MSNPRDKLADYSGRYDYDPSTVDIDDENVLSQFTEPLQDWWVDSFGQFVEENNGFFTPPQKQAIPSIQDETNTLIASPTGSGKTLASFSSVIDHLSDLAEDQELENSVYCLYVSPLKSLANDIQRNLSGPLEGMRQFMDDDTQEIRHAIRHGDTPSKERRKMLDETPHILNTTPETLAILLNSPKFRQKFETLQYIIVDEIHSLAGNKRGTHLSVSLERLTHASNHEPTRIGCSATVEPLDTIANFLCGYTDDGTPRDHKIVDTRFVRNSDISVETPVPDLIQSSREEISNKFYQRLDELIGNHDTTLVFTNTRSGAESTLNNLRGRFSRYDEDTSAAHHGSMSKENRESVEQRLKNGSYDIVTSSTSLELGVDISSVDLVIQIGSPKTIAGLLQRIGRAGHQLGETVKGRIMVLNRDELMECTVMADRAKDGFIDRVFIPERCQDVAAQQVYGMAIDSVKPASLIKRMLRRAYPYRNYDEEEFNQLKRFLTADYDGIEEQKIYPKIWYDDNDPPDGEFHYDEYDVGQKLIGKRGGKAQMIYMTNIGTIPDSFTVTVKSRSSEQKIGELDEEYLDTLEKGDVFVLGGGNYEYKYRRGSNVYVDATGREPTVPTWFSERLPLSYDLGQEILQFQENAIEKLESGGPSSLRDWVRQMPVEDITATAVTNLVSQQYAYAGSDSLSSPTNLAIEEHPAPDDKQRHYYVHSVHGRVFNDGVSRVLGQYFAEQKTTNVEIAVNDHGFSLTVPVETELDIPAALEDIESDDIRPSLRRSLDGTDFIKRHFRINATRSLAILKNYKGRSKSAKYQQVLSETLLGAAQDYDGFSPLEETYRELMEDRLDLKRVKDFVDNIPSQTAVTTYQVDSPTPRGFSLATLSGSDVVLADEESAVLRQFHERVLNEIDEEDTISLG